MRSDRREAEQELSEMCVSYTLDRRHDYRKKYLKEIELKKKELDDDYKDIIDEKEKQNMKLPLQSLYEIKEWIENYIKGENDKLPKDD